MTVLARVQSVGLATVQDGGRPGYADAGVPVSGAWHRGRYETVGRLLTGGADASVPAIELIAGELVLRMTRDVVVVVVGPALATIDGRRLATGAVVEVPASAALRVLWRGPGPVYVTLDGWSPERVLGSCATDTFSRLGADPLTAGVELTGRTGSPSRARVGWFQRTEPPTSGPIRVIATGHARAEDFAARRWTVVSQSRSGTRLRSGGWLPPVQSIPSMPMLPGAIQLSADGEAIVLGPDGGLTGGYPVVGVIASVDRDRAGLLSPGDDVAFALWQVGAAAAADSARPPTAIVDPATLG
jgi:allophanate hydrolase subunit 2